jgi:hypothetical protein
MEDQVGLLFDGDRRGRDRMVVGFTTTLPMEPVLITTYTLWVQIQLRRAVLDTTLCDKVCQWLAAGQWFSPGNHVSTTNKTDRQNISEMYIIALLLDGFHYNLIKISWYIRYAPLNIGQNLIRGNIQMNKSESFTFMME